MKASFIISAMLLLADAISSAAIAETAREEALRTHEGIWKSARPRADMRGEFDNSDPIGVANGIIIKTDCSLNWVDPDDHKLYCFNSATAVEYFRQWPKANIRRARARWETMVPTQ